MRAPRLEGHRHSEPRSVSCCYAASFVRLLIDRYGVPTVLDFFRRAGGRDESLVSIRSRAQTVCGRTFDALDADWLAMLRG